MNNMFCKSGRVKSTCGKVLKHLKETFEFKNLFMTHYSQFTKAIAFTLAETLIVMGIIGVVAALTLPNLNSSTGDKEKVAKVKKIYQNLDDAFGRAQSVYGPYRTWFVNDGSDPAKVAKRFAERLTEFMKLSKNCEHGEGCFSAQKVREIWGTEKNYSLNNGFNGPSGAYRVITADGTSIVFHPVENTIYIDIDGPNKGTNTFGKDIFDFTFSSDRRSILPKGQDYDWSNLYENCFKKGYGCTAWVIQNENMDYLKLESANSPFCPGGGAPLGQDGRTTCK